MKTKNTSSQKIACLVLIAGRAAAILLTVCVKAFNPITRSAGFRSHQPESGPEPALECGQYTGAAIRARFDCARHASCNSGIRHVQNRCADFTSEVPPASCITAHRFANRQSCEVTRAWRSRVVRRHFSLEIGRTTRCSRCRTMTAI